MTGLGRITLEAGRLLKRLQLHKHLSLDNSNNCER